MPFVIIMCRSMLRQSDVKTQSALCEAKNRLTRPFVTGLRLSKRVMPSAETTCEDLQCMYLGRADGSGRIGLVHGSGVATRKIRGGGGGLQHVGGHQGVTGEDVGE